MTADDTGKLDDISFLRETALFRDMPESVIQTIVSQGRTLAFCTGQLVVKKKTAGDSLFIVKSGVAEVVNPAEGAPLAYLGRGESFGEMALLTNSERSADVRVPQDAKLLVIDRALFDDLMTNHSGFAAQMAVILARRLVAVLEDLPDREMKRELQGDLTYFDLATVIQTLISASQSGVMTLSIDKTMVASRAAISVALITDTVAETKPCTISSRRSRAVNSCSRAEPMTRLPTDLILGSLCPPWL